MGRCRNSWVKNCVAIGLSGGFVEPLESTGIFFIQYAIEQLINHFPNRDFDHGPIDGYNRAVAACIDGVREFLTLHYVVGTRRDTRFWKATKEDLVLPDALGERLKCWQFELPSKRSVYPLEHGFTPYSYAVVMLGLGYRPKRAPAALDHMSPEAAETVFARIRRDADHLVQSLPPLYEYLCQRFTLAEAIGHSAR